MIRRILIPAFVLTLCILQFPMHTAEARRGFAIGLGPMGNIYVIDTIPVMDPGFGGFTYFQYRFAEQLAFKTGFFLTTQDGANVSSGDTGILLLGMPTLDLQYFFRQGRPKIDPYASLGTGFFMLSEGSIGNSTGGVGVGTSLGVGVDYYFSEAVSLGFEGSFRTIGIISDFGTPSSSAAIFPYSLMLSIGFHF